MADSKPLTDWIEGIPAKEAVREHEERTRAWCVERGVRYNEDGGLWMWRYVAATGKQPEEPKFIPLRADRCAPSGIAKFMEFRPCLPDGTPLTLANRLRESEAVLVRLRKLAFGLEADDHTLTRLEALQADDEARPCPDCPHPRGRHAYNGCADCTKCGRWWTNWPSRAKSEEEAATLASLIGCSVQQISERVSGLIAECARLQETVTHANVERICRERDEARSEAATLRARLEGAAHEALAEALAMLGGEAREDDSLDHIRNAIEAKAGYAAEAYRDLTRVTAERDVLREALRCARQHVAEIHSGKGYTPEHIESAHSNSSLGHWRDALAVLDAALLRGEAGR